MESRFVGKDGFIHAIAICKQRVIDCSAEDIMEILLKESPTTETMSEKIENGDLIKLKPEMPLEVSFWYEFRLNPRWSFFFDFRCKSGTNRMKSQALTYEKFKSTEICNFIRERSNHWSFYFCWSDSLWILFLYLRIFSECSSIA